MAPDLPALRLEYTCTREEQSHANTLARPIYGPRWLMWLAFIVAGGAFLFLLWGFNWVERIVFITVFAIIWMMTFFVSRQTRRPQPTKLLLLPDSLRIIIPKLDRQYDWSDFRPLIESDTLFVLQNRPKTVPIPIPKRAFPDVPSRDFLRSRMTPPAPAA